MDRRNIIEESGQASTKFSCAAGARRKLDLDLRAHKSVRRIFRHIIFGKIDRQVNTVCGARQRRHARYQVFAAKEAAWIITAQRLCSPTIASFVGLLETDAKRKLEQVSRDEQGPGRGISHS